MSGRGSDRDAVIYQNIELATGESINLSQTFTTPDGAPFTGQLADHNVQRGAAILEDAEKYWVSVQRLVVTARLPTWIAQLDIPLNAASDGVTTVYTVTLAGKVAGANVVARKSLQLQIPVERRVNYLTQPGDDYAFVETLCDVLAVFNHAFQEAWAEIVAVAPGGSVAAEDCPYMTRITGSDRIRLVCPSYELFASPSASGDGIGIYFNSNSYAILDGWPLKILTRVGKPTAADGRDLQLIVSTAAGGALDPPSDPPRLLPTLPTTQAITVDTLNPPAFPGIRNLRFLSSIPAASELTPSIGAGNATTASIFADFAVSGAQRTSRETLVFNAALQSGARWVKVNQKGPLISFSCKLTTIDYLGTERVVRLLGAGDLASVKLAWASDRIIANRARHYDDDM